MRVLPLDIVNVCKRYRSGELANRNITLSVNAGEIVCIVGPNGAGKTTLIRQVTTELRPTSGDIRVLGIDVVAHPRDAKELLGVIPQEATLYWGLKIRHQLRIFGKLRGLSARSSRQRRDELVMALGLDEHREKTTEELSGGLRRRVLLGIAAVANPPVLILDEPSVGLDPEARNDLWEWLRRCRNDGKAVLLTTHYMDEAEALCDRVGIIQRGSLLALDTVSNLRSDYGHRYKLTYTTETGSKTLYGSDDSMLVKRVQAIGIDQYSVARTSLEDVYLEITGRELLSLDATQGNDTK